MPSRASRPGVEEPQQGARQLAGQADRRQVLLGGSGLIIAGAVVTMASACGQGKASSPEQPAALTTLAGPQLDAVKAAITSGEVGVGKSKILPDVKLIVTQRAAGQYVLYSTVCPHAGGKISQVNAAGDLVCPVHGSIFDPITGKPKEGPSSQPLKAAALTVNGSNVSLT